MTIDKRNNAGDAPWSAKAARPEPVAGSLRVASELSAAPRAQYIEKYSRQIIVAGGIAQERLLAARVVIAGDAADVEPVLEYLAGAGVGHIHLLLTDTSPSRDRLLADARYLNRDVAVEVEIPVELESATVLFLIIGSSDALALAAGVYAGARDSRAIVARLDHPARIAIIPARSSEAAAELKLSAPFSRRDGDAGLTAMVAATEAFKLLIADQVPSKVSVIEFDGYQTRLALNPSRS